MNKPSDKSVNNLHRYLLAEEEPETAVIEGIHYVRGLDEVWRYAESGIEVPGAEDVTLTDRFQPKFIVSQDGAAERVVVSGESIAAAPELLGWCLKEGTPITIDGKVDEVIVPFALWEERDRVPGELYAPEHHGDPPRRELAMAEREVREAEKLLEAATDLRAEVLRRYADQMTRQEARTITGLSVGRVQQLIRSDKFEEHELAILEIFEDGPLNSMDQLQAAAAERGLPADPDVLSAMVRNLEDSGFLIDVPGGVAISDTGLDAVLETREVEAG